MIMDNIMLSMVHDLQLSNRHEVTDGAPQTSRKTKCIGHASSGYLKVAEGPSGTDCEY